MRGAIEEYQCGENSYWLPIAQSRIREMEVALLELQR
jgi:hypothetical protein